MILIAPTVYKGTIGAAEASRALAAGVRRAVPGRAVVELPLSDGGPGLVEALHAVRGGRIERVRVSGPLGEPADARLLVCGGDVIVETADACGLHRVPREARDPLRATTYGVGELVRAAAERAAGGRLVLGLGGSATVDGGAGMAQALGWRLLDRDGRPIPSGGAGLERLERIEAPASRTAAPHVLALADVLNPLLGPNGAAAVFGPQKGADAEGVARLERGLARFADRVEAELGPNVREAPGTGAAGGLGAGVVAFLNGQLVPGSAWVLDAVGFDAALARAELVVTGEGRWDAQSAMGKITGVVLERAARAGVPALLVAGRVEADVPAGVVAAAGDGRALTPARLASIAAREAARLLR